MDRIVDPGHFASLAPPEGRRAFAISVGHIAIAFQGLSEALHAACLKRYAAFLTERTPIHTATVHAGEGTYLDPAPDGFLRLEETGGPEGRVLLSTEFAAFWPQSSSEGVLRLSRPDHMKSALMCLENYLRWVTAELALEHGGFVLHSSGLAREGRAHIFFGHSGAGKSTVASLSPGCALLSDDLVLILREGGRWAAATTPFFGTLAQEAKDLGIYPVAGFYRLIQSPEVSLEAVSPAKALGLVVSCCPFVAGQENRNKRLLPLVEACTREVPVRLLRFRKDATFWDTITGEVRRG